MLRITTLTLLGALAPDLLAQNPCEGNGIGNAYLSTTPMIVNGSGTINVGSPTATNSIGLLLWGNGAGPAIPFCLDTSLFFFSQLVVLDATGNATVTINATPPNFPTTLFAKGLILESNFDWSLSKTALVSVEYSDSWREIGALAQARSLHTLTTFDNGALDNVTGALVAGGATGSLVVPTALDTTEVYDPLNRGFTAGPNLSIARARHTAARLRNGDVLICGGMTNVGGGIPGGPGSATCEQYDPSTNSILPFPSMLQQRLGHAMTVLGDGRVLVSGGFADWTDAGNNFVARLNTVIDSTEIWDPVTNTWTAGPTMSSVRGGHTQTLLDDGRVLIVGGCNGGTTITIPFFPPTTIDVPTFASSCEIFDPSTNSLSAAQSLSLARGFHGASRLANGFVIVTGGAALIGSNGEAAATNSCAVYNPSANVWTNTGNLQTGVAFHTQVAHPTNGNAVVMGGGVSNFQQLLGTPRAAEHDGSLATALADIGTHPTLTQTLLLPGSHATAVLQDGTILLTGGYESQILLGSETDRCFVYIP